MVELFYGNTKAKISNLGAELKSFKSDGVEYIWQGDKHIWNSSAPILFPICSSLKDNEYIYEGKTYRLPKHGFASNRFFSIEHKTDSSVTFLLKSEEADKTQYFLIWTIPKADFVCLEPWCGITDNIDHDKYITKKEGINPLDQDQVFVRSHSIEII